MKTVSCRRCGEAGGDRLLWEIPDRLWYPDSLFRLVECGRCRFVYLNPRPDETEIERHYPVDAYHAGDFPDRLPAAFSWRLGEIETRQPGGRLLDVGCGNGFFLAFARERGWDVYGVDTAPGGIREARKRLGDRAVLATLREAGYPSDHFDVVSLFEVFEHLPDPIDHLKEIRRILKRGGWVCLSVPNFASLERLLFGRWWVGLDAPRHFQQFTAESLGACLETAGLLVAELHSINADRIQAGKRAITYCQESLRFFLCDLGLYPRCVIPAREGVPAAASFPAPAWKRGLHGLEWTIFFPFCLLARWLDRDNTLWAWGRKG